MMRKLGEVIMKGRKSQNPQSRSGANRESGQPGRVKGRKDKVGPSGGYRFTHQGSPDSGGVRPAGSSGERGGRGHQDYGGSELTYEGGRLLGACEEGSGNLAAHSEREGVEIPAEEWISFFNGFSRQHEGWLTTIILKQNGKSQTEVRERKLKGVSCDHLTTRDEIYVSIDGGDGAHLTHAIKNPVKVVFRRDFEGAHEGMDITSAEGTVTSVRFRIAARPETLDGAVESEHPPTP
jgi:hypothetical protein